MAHVHERTHAKTYVYIDGMSVGMTYITRLPRPLDPGMPQAVTHGVSTINTKETS